MRPHPSIAPKVRRIGGKVELVVELAPLNGDLVKPLVVELTPRAGLRLLRQLLDAMYDRWLPDIVRQHR